MECPVCAEDPTSHSFKQIETLPDGTVIMYTKPAEASKYWDRDGILFHYDQKLSTVGDWVWVFDAEGFSFEHMLEVDVAISLAKLISSKYSQTLKKIMIVNPSFMVQIMLTIVTPFLNKHIRSLIVKL
jgi:hypothetical protein